MALIKGNKPVKKNKKRALDYGAILPYLKQEKLGFFNRFTSFFHFLFHSFFLINIISFNAVIILIYTNYLINYIPFYFSIIYILSVVLSYYLSKKFNEGWFRFFLVDGVSWWKTSSLLSPKNPSPGLKILGTQLVTSRFLAVPGPQSSHNGLAKGMIPYFCMMSCTLVIPFGVSNERAGIQGDIGLAISIGFILLLFGWTYAFKVMGKPIYQPRRFFIFDRKKQTLSYHSSFISRKMVTYPWAEFEGRAMAVHRSGYCCILTHAPTGNMLELQGPDLHWNNAGAVEAYSYVARFMDLSQPLPDEVEFERYLPRDEDLSHISDENERIRMRFHEFSKRQERRRKYHNPNADTVFSKIASFEQAIQKHPWLSAKNVWTAAHKYGKQPNWDKWVRDKWGIAANEDYQVPEDEKEGEPDWFPQFFEHLKSNRKKLKDMDDDTRILFFQNWFEETFPELHWVDPITADSYEQEETFS